MSSLFRFMNIGTLLYWLKYCLRVSSLIDLWMIFITICTKLFFSRCYAQHSSHQKLVVVEVDGRIARRNPQRTTDDQYPSVLPRSQQWHRIREYTCTISYLRTLAAGLADLYRCVWGPDHNCTRLSVWPRVRHTCL